MSKYKPKDIVSIKGENVVGEIYEVRKSKRFKDLYFYKLKNEQGGLVLYQYHPKDSSDYLKELIEEDCDYVEYFPDMLLKPATKEQKKEFLKGEIKGEVGHTWIFGKSKKADDGYIEEMTDSFIGKYRDV